MSNLETKLVRVLFVLIVPALMLQFRICRTKGEFYPALIMPSFAGGDVASGKEVYTEQKDLFVEFEDGTRQAIAISDFVQDAPKAYRRNIVRTTFSHNSFIRERYRDGLIAWTFARCVQVTGRKDVAWLRNTDLRVVHRFSEGGYEVLRREPIRSHDLRLEWPYER